MFRDISRRRFFRHGAAAGLGAWAAGLSPTRLLAAARPGRAAGPIIVTSHTNATGQRAMEAAWEILSAGGTATDAVERGANIIEEDPDDTSVGYGGLPNEDGVVQLDASFMDGKTYNAGAVAALERIKHPASVARIVMERTDHVMLVGPAALDFAKSWGFPEEDLLTERARQIWLRWRQERDPDDDWGPPDHLRGQQVGAADSRAEIPFHYGTVNVLAVDVNGDIAGITTTSGLSWKINGRIGDSPIIGAGLYVDNEVGAAGATGRGEDVIKSCASYYIVLRMRDGRSPQEACEDALRMIAEKYRAVGIDYMPGEKFVAVNRAGEVGCAWSYDRGGNRPSMTVMTGTPEIYEGTIVP